MSAALFSPIRMRDVDIANRVVVSPMCQYSAEGGCATDWHLAHLGSLSASGAGLLVFEATAVEPQGRISHGDLGLYDDACEIALERVVDFCRKHGTAKLGIQIGHAGRKASAQRPWEGGGALSADENPWETVAPSAVAFGDTWHEPREMDDSALSRVLSAHVETAKRAERLSFDVLEVHAAHGYLLHQFLSPISNRRDDAYGGNAEKRMRYPLEVIKAVRAVWPETKPLGVRITGKDWIAGGIDINEAAAFAARLKEIAVDFVCVSSGAITPDARPDVFPGYQVDLATEIRRLSALPVRAVGLIADPRQAAEIVDAGKADMVALARAFLDNPHWAWHAALELGADVARPPQYERAAPQFWSGAKIG